MAELSINLLQGNAEKLEKRMTQGALVWGKALCKHKWDGVNSIKALSLRTYASNDYDPTKSDGPRFGTLQEVEDDSHIYTLQYNKSNNLSIDKTYNTEQKMKKRAGVVIGNQIDEIYTPEKDKQCLEQYSKATGVATREDATIDTSNVNKVFAEARTTFVNNKTKGNGKHLVAWVPSSIYSVACLSDKFLNLEKVGTQALVDGAVGKLSGFQIIEVPDDYMPEGVNIIFANLKVLMNVQTIDTCRVLKEHPDVDGSVCQFHYRYGIFVEETNAKGVLVSKTTA